MAYDPKHSDRLDALAERLRAADAVTPDLMAQVLAQACPRLPLLNKNGKVAARFTALLQASAWTDLALALVEIELPGWSLRRLVCDGGEWFCSLSHQPALPAEFDDTADAMHPVLALAIAGSLLEAQRRTVLTREPVLEPPMSGHPVCCENFA